MLIVGKPTEQQLLNVIGALPYGETEQLQFQLMQKALQTINNDSNNKKIVYGANAILICIS